MHGRASLPRREYYFTDDCRTRGFRKGKYLLIPPYDEYLIGYKSRDIVLSPDYSHKAHNNSGIFQPIIAHDGVICGNWTPFKEDLQATFFMGEHETDIQEEWKRYSSGTKQFLLTLLATTFSIILTFGTSAIIDRRHKAAAKKEMVMMILYDFDKTIEQVQKAESAIHQAKEVELEVARHPEYYDSLRFYIMPAVTVASEEFSETTENIFSSNIETFNTLGNVNFVHEVSSFYSQRRSYQQQVLDELKKEVLESEYAQNIESFLDIGFPTYSTRNRCMQMMKVSEEELKEFSNQRLVNEDHSEDLGSTNEQMLMELFEEEDILKQAKEKLEQNH